MHIIKHPPPRGNANGLTIMICVVLHIICTPRGAIILASREINHTDLFIIPLFLHDTTLFFLKMDTENVHSIIEPSNPINKSTKSSSRGNCSTKLWKPSYLISIISIQSRQWGQILNKESSGVN